MQTKVERVEDKATARDAEVALHVLVVVPRERRDAVATLEPELLERHRELPGAPGAVAVGVAVEALVGEPRHDLLVREVCLRTPQERRERQLEVHHQAVHEPNRNLLSGIEQRLREDAVA